MIRILGIVSLVFLLSIASVCSQEEAKQLEGRVTGVKGEVIYAPAGTDESKDESWQPVTVGLKLKSGDTIYVCDKAQMIMEFDANSTEAVIEQNSYLKLDACYEQAGKVVQDLRLLTGTVSVDVRNPSVQTDMQIATPEATASVKGTLTIANRSAGQGSTFSVVRGLVSVGNGKGGSRNIGAGEKTNGNLIETLKAAKLNPDAVVNILPGGTPGDELELLLINYTGAVSLLPSDLTGGGNPVIDKIIQQEGIAGQQKEKDDENYGELPPQYDE